MCFLLLHHRTRADAPIVLLANRDERFDRPFAPPTWQGARGAGSTGSEPCASFAMLSPRDLEAGGTWLGVTRGGFLAAITNRREATAPAGPLSRGFLVDGALVQRDARAAVAWARDYLTRVAFAGFNLLLADARDAFVVRHAGAPVPRAPDKKDVVRLAPGAHALTNLHDLDEVPVPPAGRPIPEEPLAATLARLEALAADDRTPLPRDHRIFKHRERVPGAADGKERGTVCSAVVAVPRAGAPTFRFAAGPPDRTPFVTVS